LLTTPEFINKAKRLHGDLYDYSNVEYVDSETKVEIICKKHGSFWQSPVGHIYSQKQGCPVCQSSKGERKIIEILTRNNVSFDRQKRFKECRNSLPLPFDFYFQINNLRCLLEFDGPHHFQSIEGWGGKDAFEITKRHDFIKTKFAQDFGFTLIRISHKQFDKIEEILRPYLL